MPELETTQANHCKAESLKHARLSQWAACPSHLEACCQIEQQECVRAQFHSQHLQINKTRSNAATECEHQQIFICVCWWEPTGAFIKVPKPRVFDCWTVFVHSLESIACSFHKLMSKASASFNASKTHIDLGAESSSCMEHFCNPEIQRTLKDASCTDVFIWQRNISMLCNMPQRRTQSLAFSGATIKCQRT